MILAMASCATDKHISNYALAYSVDSTVNYFHTGFPRVDTYLLKYNRGRHKYDTVFQCAAGGFIDKRTMMQEYTEAMLER